MNLRVIDLFCGAGGLSTGLSQAGWRIAAGIDVSGDELLAFGAAHGWSVPIVMKLASGETSVYGSASRLFDITIAMKADVLVGGPPCQPFSRGSAKRKKEADERNGWPVTLALMEIMKPKVVLTENVPGLAMKGGVEYLNRIIGIMRGFGYHVDYRILDAADFGVPQNRKRLFIQAIRADMEMEPRWPEPTHFGSHRGWGTVVDLNRDLNEKATKIVRKHLDRWKGDPVEFALVQGKQHSTTYAPPIRTPDQPSATVTIHHDCKLLVHAPTLGQRHLLVSELAALQGFPGMYPFWGTLTSKRRQIGNAVPPPLAWAVGSVIAEMFKSRGS